MYYKSWEELKKLCAVKNGKWDRDVVYQYLVYSCHRSFKQPLDTFFSRYRQDEGLAELLFSYLLDDTYDGSDCQMGAAFYIAKLDKSLLRKKKELLLLAQRNEVAWKRPFPEGEGLEWL